MILSVSLFILIILFKAIFTINNIEIESQIPRDQLIGITNFQFTNLFLLSLKDAENLLLSLNPQAKKISLIKKFPQTLLIKIESNTPIALLKLDSGYAALSPEGKIIYKTHSQNQSYPVVNFYQKLTYQSLNPSDILDYKEIQNMLYFLKKSRDLNLKVDNVDINGSSMIVFNLKDKSIIFSNEIAKEKQSFELETIIRQFKIEAKDFKILDLRFDKPIVKF